MQRSTLTSPTVAAVVLIMQFIPLVMFPLSLFTIANQDWWLPMLLAIMVIIADIQIMVQRSVNLGPWYLLGFAQGFNIISRLMMIWSHATRTVGGANVPDWNYIILTAVSLAMSFFMLWYVEQPHVRVAFLSKG